MKRIILIVVFHIFFLSTAQQSKIRLLQISQNVERNFVSKNLKIEKVNNNPFVAFSIVLKGININNAIENVYFKNIEDRWQLFPKEAHNFEKDAWYALAFLDKDIKSTQLKVVLKNTIKLQTIKLNFYYPKATATLKNYSIISPKSQTEIESCNCAKPQTVPRSEWCPNNNCPPNPNPIATDVKFLIVHHTATSNTSNDWAATVRSIWDFHVNTRGWADIGYNFLIDKNGKIYDAREDDTKGAHFSGHNSQTSGMSLMGTYTTTPPSNAMITALESLLTWKTCNKSIDPLAIKFHNSSGLNLHTISGHRDGGNTTCPGDQVYNKLTTIRTNVNTLLSSCTLAVSAYDFDNLNVYPNPFKNDITINSTDIDFSKIKITIYDITGRQVYLKHNVISNQQLEVNLDFLPSGVFILTVQGDKKIGHYRLIKK